MNVTVTPGDVFPDEVAGMVRKPVLKRRRRLRMRKRKSWRGRNWKREGLLL